MQLSQQADNAKQATFVFMFSRGFISISIFMHKFHALV
jgi:hypothetical protein